MNKRALVKEYAQKQRYFSLNQIVKSIGLGRQLAIKYLQSLKAEKIVFSAGRGLYTTISKEFVCPKKSRVDQLRQIIKKEFPDLDFIIWNTLYFQPFYHHQQTHHITFVEVEYDGVHSVADKISRFYRYVFVETKSKDFPPGFDITRDPVVVRRLIGRSPRNGNEPSLEKMLVDLYIIKDKYKTMPDADYWELWRDIYSLYPQKCVRRPFLTVSSTRQFEDSFAKTKIFGQAQFLNFVGSLLELLAIMVIFGKGQNILNSMFGQLGRQNQKVGADRIQRGAQIFFGQTKSFEPVNNIGREQKQLEECDVGTPSMSRNFGQGIIVKELAIVFLDGGSGTIEQINPPGRDFEIGDEDMIDVFGVFEQFELFGFLRVFGNGTSHHDKAVQAVPLLIDVREEFADFPAVLEFLESALLRLNLDRRIFFGHDDVTAAGLVEELDGSLSVKSRIRAKADSTSGDIRGRFGQTSLQKRDDSRRRTGVARSQRSMPEFLPVRFEAKQGMIRPPSFLFGVVSNPSALLSAINRNHHRIDIEGQAGRLLGQFPQISAQTVVQSRQLSNRLRTQPLQKSSQSRLIRETLQSENLQKKSIVLQYLGLVDSPESHDDRIQQGQNHLGRMITLILLRETDRFLQKFFESQLFAKTVNQRHSTKVSRMAFLEEKLNLLQSFGHNTPTIPGVCFPCESFYSSYYISSSSELNKLKISENRISRFFEVV